MSVLVAFDEYQYNKANYLMHTIRETSKPRVLMYTGWRMLVLDIFL